MKRIEVNNGAFIEIESKAGGISVADCNAQGYVERRDHFDDGEIVMALNLLRYMRDNDQKSAWLMNAETMKYLENLIRNGDLEEYRIFQ